MKEVKRPWGNFKLFAKNKKCTVKLITLKPKQELSLQYHKKRDEMWYFLTPAIVQISLKKMRVKKGDIVKIKKGRAHRVTATKKPAQFIEISFGKFSERDEIRIEDKYGRK